MQPIPEIDLLSNIRESDVAHPTDGRRQLSLTDEDFTPRPVASLTDWSTVAARPTEHVGGQRWEMGNWLRCRKRVYGFYGKSYLKTKKCFFLNQDTNTIKHIHLVINLYQIVVIQVAAIHLITLKVSNFIIKSQSYIWAMVTSLSSRHSFGGRGIVGRSTSNFGRRVITAGVYGKLKKR